jgi:hypothetical protein
VAIRSALLPANSIFCPKWSQPSSPPSGTRHREALGALVKANAEKWWPIIKEFGIKRE